MILPNVLNSMSDIGRCNVTMLTDAFSKEPIQIYIDNHNHRWNISKRVSTWSKFASHSYYEGAIISNIYCSNCKIFQSMFMCYVEYIDEQIIYQCDMNKFNFDSKSVVDKFKFSYMISSCNEQIIKNILL